MYGWRGRIGLIIPSSNTTCEMEFHKMAPEGVSVHTARVFNPQVSKAEDKEEAELSMNRALLKAAKELASIQAGVILYANTTGSFIKGPGYDKELGEIIKTETGTPGYSTTTAVVEALNIFGLKSDCFGNSLSHVHRRKGSYILAEGDPRDEGRRRKTSGVFD